MKAANTYLFFDGNCREAMTFYGECFGGEPNFTPYSVLPVQPGAQPVAAPDRILHSEFRAGDLVLMGSDFQPDSAFVRGNNFSISLTCESLAEMERVFGVLSAGGQVQAPMHDAFWGDRFGMLTDRFGTGWMLTFRPANPPA